MHNNQVMRQVFQNTGKDKHEEDSGYGYYHHITTYVSEGFKGLRGTTHVVKSSPKVLALKERMSIRTTVFFARGTVLLCWMKKAGG